MPRPGGVALRRSVTETFSVLLGRAMLRLASCCARPDCLVACMPIPPGVMTAREIAGLWREVTASQGIML